MPHRRAPRRALAWLRGPLAGLAAFAALCLGTAAEASGRSPLAIRGGEFVASSYPARGLVAEAARWIGAGKFTPLPGPWCADAVSFWLRAIGKPPLANRLAASALSYGPRVAAPRAGDLAVMRTRRGRAGHVGIVEGVEPDGSIVLISGNWANRVARSVVPRWLVVAFVAVR